MAHKSKKKHLKHLHAHQRASAATAETTKEPKHDRGIVRSIAHAAAEKIMDKERKIVKKVKSLLG